MTDIEFQNMRAMADCMDMVRRELIEATIIEANVAPMFVANAVMKYINECREDFNLAVDSVAELQEEVFGLQKELAHWKANHANEVKRARVLIERPDLPLERVKAYEQIGDMQDECSMWHGLLVDVAMALKGPETGLEGGRLLTLASVAAEVKEEAQRFAIVRHAARAMQDEGGEAALMEAMDEYKAQHGL